MSKKVYFLISFVLVLSWASAGYSDGFKIDIDDAADPNTEPNYVGFVIADSGSDVNGYIIDLTYPYIDDRRSVDPNAENEFGYPINEEQIHRDFIFGSIDQQFGGYGGITVVIWGLGQNQQADVHIWAFDDASENNQRIADWTANGQELLTTSFIGGDYFQWPSDWNAEQYRHYDFNGIATADDVGRIVLNATLNEDGDESEPYAFLNALELYTIGAAVPVTKAHRPVPFDGVEEVEVINPILSWLPGTTATSHDVYFSTSFDDVNSRNAGALVADDQDPCSYTPSGTLQLETTYYWCVDENPGGAGLGDVWSFTTKNYIIVDDFTAYGPGTGLEPADRWDDYYVNGTSSEVTLNIDVARDGNSMNYEFLNASFFPHYSEASIDITQAGVNLETDFNSIKVESVSVWFYGQPNNPTTEQMYLSVTDGSSNVATVNYSGDMNDVNKEEWQEWNTSMPQLKADNPSLDLSDIEVITLGFAQGAGGGADGIVFIDDVVLYATRCVPLERSAGVAKADYAPVGDTDCEVDNIEVGVMSRDWLAPDFVADTIKVGPNDPNCVLYLRFDEFHDANEDGLLNQEIIDFIFDQSESNDLNGVIVTQNLAQGDRVDPNGFWAILSPVNPDPNDAVTVESAVIIRSPGVGEEIDGNFPDGTPFVDGQCIYLNQDGQNPGERVHCGRWPVVGKFDPGTPVGGHYRGKGLLSLAAWIKWGGPHVGIAKSQGIISRRNGWSDSTVIWMFEIDTIPGPRGSFSMRQFDGDVSSYTQGGILDLYIDQWVHVAAVAEITDDNNDVILYLNGAEQQRGLFYFGGGVPGDITMTVANIADLEHQGVESYIGEMDEVYVFDRALEPNEIAYLADKTPDDGQVYVPPASAANIIDPEAQGSRLVNFVDFAVMANEWLVKELWP